jgi:hypothetical protein
MAAIIDITQQAPASPISQKRKRADSETQPLSPPLSASPASPCSVPTIAEGTHLLSRAVNVLSTAATALAQVSVLYETDPVAREGLLRAVELVTNINEAGGKLIICGVGKSGLVGQKMVATMKSLGIGSSFMHAAEAIHGDLGDIRKVLRVFAAELRVGQTYLLTWNRTTPLCSSHTLARRVSSWLYSTTFLRTRLSLPSHRTRTPRIARC